MNKKAQMSFSMIVVAILAMTVLVIVFVWLFPSLSDSFRQTEDIKDSAGVNDVAITTLNCERLCSEAIRLDDQTQSKFCTKVFEDETVCTDYTVCEEVTC
jgi:hypothetical protein